LHEEEVNMEADHLLFRGLLGHMFGTDSAKITSKADVILICGTYVFPEVFPELSGVFAPPAKVIGVDLDAYEMGKNLPFHLGLLASPKLTLELIGRAVEDRMTAAQARAASERIRAAQKRVKHDREEQYRNDRMVRESVPLHMPRFAEELAPLLPEDAIVFDEALTHSGELCRYIVPRTPGRYYQTRGGSLGVAIPGAIGMKLAHPDKTVIGFAGDGAAMYTIQALWTAAHHRIGAKFVVCNNRSYRLLKMNLERYWSERSIEPHAFPDSFDITDPDLHFVGLAHSMGVDGARVERPDQIQPAIERARADDKPFLIDLILSSDLP